MDRHSLHPILNYMSGKRGPVHFLSNSPNYIQAVFKLNSIDISLKGMHLLVSSHVSVNAGSLPDYLQSVINSLMRNTWRRCDLVFKVSEGQFSYGISSLNINSSKDQSLISFVYTVTRRHQKFMFPGNQTLDELSLDGIWLRKEN